MSEDEKERDSESENRSTVEGLIEKAGLFVPQFLRDKLGGILAVPHELERRIEDGIQRTLSLLDLPRREEITELHERLDSLLERCDRLLEKRGSVN